MTYVSLQGPEFCERSLHAGDGVHFTMAGYALMWQKAASAAGLPVVVAAASEHKAVYRKKKIAGYAKNNSKNNRKKPVVHKRVTPTNSAPN